MAKKNRPIRKSGNNASPPENDSSTTTNDDQQQQQHHPSSSQSGSSSESTADNINTSSSSSSFCDRYIPHHFKQMLNYHEGYLLRYVRRKLDVISYVTCCCILGFMVGFGVGCGWFTLGYGSYRYDTTTFVNNNVNGVPHMTTPTYIVSGWRVGLAGRVRGSLGYRLLFANENNGAAVTNGDAVNKNDMSQTTLLDEQPFWFSLSNLLSSSPASPHRHHHSNNLQNFNNNNNIIGRISPIASTVLNFILPRKYHLSSESGSTVNMNIPTAETLHYATNTWNNRPSSPMPLLSTSSPTPTTRIIDPYYDPMAFHTLREYIIRHARGYVHPDLGYLIPAPSGAARGIGMVRDTYNQCQVYCYPGTAEEVLEHTKHDIDKVRAIRKDPWKDYPMIVEYPDIIKSPIMTAKTGTVEQIQNVLMKQSKAAYDNYNNNNNNDAPYTQQTLMMRIPLSAQITRHNALQILNPLIPEDFKATTPLEHLDDAFLLAILLVYEGGLRSKSRYWPYIATLPPHPSCAMHRAWRQSIVDVLTALSTEMGTDTRVWPNEIAKASDSMDKIAGSLMHFVSFFEYNHDMFQSHHEAMRWSLCQVASRAIAGNAEYGRLRLVPMMDMLNHDEAAEKFIELSGNETVADGHFVGAVQEDAGTFVIRSSRYGRRKVLRRGQELMANYNVPHYSAFDWFLNMGYVPPERDGGYVMLDAALPKVGRRAKYKTPVAGEG